MPDLLVILGNQLFAPSHLSEVEQCPVFMAEDAGLCTHFKYHKHKLILFLASMRNHADELRKQKWSVDYHELNASSAALTYEQKLHAAVRQHQADRLVMFEIEDKFFEKRIAGFCRSNGLQLRTLTSPMFLTRRDEFAQHLQTVKKPFMKTFYERQRKRLSIMVDERGKPLGGQFSFDADNRKPLPANISPPEPRQPRHPPAVAAVSKLVDALFPDHPGQSNDFWLPTTRRDALAWLDNFVRHRLPQFGPYEDALTTRSDFVFHSVISPLINLGLLTPDEIIRAAIAREPDIASLEGFVRQVIGWREFIRGIYQNYSAQEERRNFFKHRRKLTDHWYRGDTGIPVLDHAIQKVTRLGWCHHIERLMVISNLMLLCEVHPGESHRWFMEMFVDSSDWVMGPNVYGMGQFSDGGIFATKPYICGSNYFLKMSDTPRSAAGGDWCDIVDGLFWGFLEKNRAFFSRNPRTMMMVRNLDRLESERKAMLFSKGEAFKNRVTTAGR